MRRIFFVALFRQFRVVWPILSGILFAMVGPGLLIGHLERWRVDDALYFTFVTGLTIGYGDLTPRHGVSRLLAVVIGFAGIVLTGVVAAASVQALLASARDPLECNRSPAELRLNNSAEARVLSSARPRKRDHFGAQ